MTYSKLFKSKRKIQWREYYFSYNFFKKLIQTLRILNITEIRELKIYECFCSELEKTSLFLSAKMLEIEKNWKNILYNYILYEKEKEIPSENLKEKELVFKSTIQSFYCKVYNLIEYSLNNFEAAEYFVHKFRKFLLKDNKDFFFPFEKLLLKSSICLDLNRLKTLMKNIISMNLALFYDKQNKDKAYKDLKKLSKKYTISIWDRDFFSFFCGISMILILLLIFLCWGLNFDKDAKENFRYIFPIFRGVAFFIFYLWLLALNVYGWLKYQIDYKRILNFNSHSSSLYEILKRAAFFSTIFLFVFLWFIVVNCQSIDISSNVVDIPKNFLPLITWIVFLGYLFFPSIKIFNGKGRLYLFHLVGEIIFCSPFYINFNTSWVNDQILSLVIPLRDFAYTVCYYIAKIDNYYDEQPSQCSQNTVSVGFLVMIFPVIYRNIQFMTLIRRQKFCGGVNLQFLICCFVLMVNTILSFLWSNNSTNEFVFIFWAISAALLSIHGFYMDIAKDWGLLQTNSKFLFLRKSLLYPKNYYYLAMILNFMLRFAWILSIDSTLYTKVMRPELFTFVIGLLEIIRRAIWNFVKIENLMTENLQIYIWEDDIQLPFDQMPTDEENPFDNELLIKPDFLKKKQSENIINHHFLPKIFASCRDCRFRKINHKIRKKNEISFENIMLKKNDEVEGNLNSKILRKYMYKKNLKGDLLTAITEKLKKNDNVQNKIRNISKMPKSLYESFQG